MSEVPNQLDHQLTPFGLATIASTTAVPALTAAMANATERQAVMFHALGVGLECTRSKDVAITLMSLVRLSSTRVQVGKSCGRGWEGRVERRQPGDGRSLQKEPPVCHLGGREAAERQQREGPACKAAAQRSPAPG